MTARVITLTVNLDSDFRIDDVPFIVDAIKMIKHVNDVIPNIYTSDDRMNVNAGINNFKRELIGKLMDLI